MADATATGYHVEVETDFDRQIRRNRTARWLQLGLVSVSTLALGYYVPGYLGAFMTGGWGRLADLFSISGVIAGAWYLGNLIPRKGLLTVPTVQGFITQDPFEVYYRGPLSFLKTEDLDGSETEEQPTGTMVVYGPGLHPTYIWESRDENGNHSLEVITKTFVERLPTKTAEVVVTVSLQYKAHLADLRRFAGNDATTIESGIESFVRSFLSTRLAKMTSDQAKNKIAELNQELADEFRGRTDGEQPITAFERGYGIHVTTLVIEGIDFGPKVQESRDAKDRAAQIRKIIVQMTGLTEKELKVIAREDKQRYKELVDQALVQAGQATMNVQVVQGTAGNAMAAGFANMLDNSSRRRP